MLNIGEGMRNSNKFDKSIDGTTNYNKGELMKNCYSLELFFPPKLIYSFIYFLT